MEEKSHLVICGRSHNGSEDAINAQNEVDETFLEIDSNPLSVNISPDPSLPNSASPSSSITKRNSETHSQRDSMSPTDALSIPPPVKTNPEHRVPFVLAFHKAEISEGHYFWYNDYHQFCRNGLLQLTQQSAYLQHAVAAFSSLVYSACIDPTTNELAFIYYSKALHQLKDILENVSSVSTDQHIFILATVLELATFEVCS